MQRWLRVVGIVIWGVVLSSCGGASDTPQSGGGSSGSSSGGQPGAVVSQLSAPRERPLPSGDPFDFEAPFSAGQFVRKSMLGHSTATQAGGLQATYAQGDQQIVLTAYYFDTSAEAANLVTYTLGSAALREVLATPATAAQDIFGAAQDRHGGYLAVWSRQEWAFLVRTPGDVATLNAFLDAFPY